MPNYVRACLPGATWFFTVVTYGRDPLLTSTHALTCLRMALRKTRMHHPFRIDAICVLPDHLHCIWTLPPGENDFSLRWNMIKGLFTKQYLSTTGQRDECSASRQRKGEAGIWQRRFWEHLIRDETDFERHMDYIHYNPVRHGHVIRPLDWQWSSFHRYVRNGWYEHHWGAEEPVSIRTLNQTGE